MTRYPATVIDNADPEELGRLMLEIPGICGDDDPAYLDWVPCRLTAAGDGVAGLFIVPPIGAAVWVECDGPRAVAWVGAGFGGPNTVPPDLRGNYPRRSGFSSPLGRHLLVLDEDTGLLLFVEDDVNGIAGARSYLAINSDGTATIGGGRGGTMRLTPEEIVLLSPAGNVVQLADGDEIKIVHEDGAEYITLGGGVSKLSGTAVQVYGGTIELGGGSVPPTHPFIKSTTFFSALAAALTELASLVPAPGATTTLATALTAGGAAYLSTRIKGD